MSTSSKAKRYIDALRQYALEPLAGDQLSTSCYAACMLCFACIDGLGKLLHPNSNAGVRERFTWFITNYMSQDYHNLADGIYQLRCDLDHNCVAVGSFLSSLADSQTRHLEFFDDELFINTRQLHSDVLNSVNAVEQLLESSPQACEMASSRLESRPLKISGYDPNIKTTQPPDVYFGEHLRWKISGQ
jgi:hypothetical protein